jgi:hypothetical protein
VTIGQFTATLYSDSITAAAIKGSGSRGGPTSEIPVPNARNRACHDVGLRTVHPNEIDVDGRQPFERSALVAREGNGLEKDLGQYHRRPAVQITAARPAVPRKQ